MTRRIGIFLPNWIGDVVMATPALRAIRNHFQNRASLIGIMRPYVSEVLAGTTWLDRHLLYDRKSLAGMRRLVWHLRDQELDTVLLLTNSFSTGLFAWLSGARRRIGFALHRRRWLLTDPLEAPRQGRQLEPRSAVDHYLDVIRALDCEVGSPLPELATTPAEEHAADRAWQSFGWTARDPVVVLNTGGAYGAAKTWPDDYFTRLARRLVDDRPELRVLVICGPAERESARRVCAEARHVHVRSLAEERLSLGLSKACVRRARLMITTDSGPRHFAAAFRVPAVTIFGPTDPRWSHNYHSAAIHLQLDVPCGPCGKRVCPYEHHRCMRQLTVEHVAVAAASLLDTRQRAA